MDPPEDHGGDEDNGPRFPPGGMDLVYVKIADDIEARIRRGEWQHGDRLPNREELAREYGAAVMSVRRAQAELVTRGLVRVVQGKGAFVDLGGTHLSHDEP